MASQSAMKTHTLEGGVSVIAPALILSRRCEHARVHRGGAFVLVILILIAPGREVGAGSVSI